MTDATLTAFDYAVIVVIGLSALRGMWRGLLAEVFGLIGWVVALIVAAVYAPALVRYVPANWPGGVLTQYLVAFFGLAATVLVVSGVVGALITRLAEAGGLRGVDRTLGILFGLIRGVLLVLVLMAVAGLTELPRQNFWRNAMFRPYAEYGVRELKPFLPAAIAAYVHF
ncbi:CvpA family protein [Mycetohabitans endofungorum]|uniref:CvpA family protein n=1 Tax=Mycetohabitans endofungorum TaxID=417203 RepID=UPI002B052878|nr:CvpA family protein [Mycetohabitans endofungorum]